MWRRARRGLIVLRSFSYSALIMFYGAGLMWLGFARRSALLRWQAILLIAATVIKVFFFDVWELDHGWRVLSFIILGVLLLAVSYAYQRDWLGLQQSALRLKRERPESVRVRTPEHAESV